MQKSINLIGKSKYENREYYTVMVAHELLLMLVCVYIYKLRDKRNKSNYNHKNLLIKNTTKKK